MRGCRACLALTVWLALVAAAARATAAPVAVVDTATRHLSLAPHLDVLEDPSATLTLDDVKKPEHAARFVPCKEPFGPNYGFTRSAVWVRFTVENAGDAPLERWLVVDTVPVEHVAVFRDGEPPSLQGSLHPRAARELSRRTYSFRIALAPRQTRIVFMRAWGDSEKQLPMDLWDLDALAAHDRAVASWGAFLFGVAFAMALYNVFLFLFVGDRVRLYYAGFVVSALLWCACVDGVLLDSLPQRIGTLPHQVNVISVGIELTFAWLFLRRLLEVPGSHPRIDWAFGALFCVGIGIFMLYLVGVIAYRITNLLMPPLMVAMAFGWIAVAALRWRERLSAARYVVFAWSAFLVIAMLAVLGVNGLIPVRLNVVVPLSVALEATVFSLALADASRQRNRQIARMHRESELLNQELQRQIADRAGQLAGAIARLSAAPRALSPGDVLEDRYRVVRALGQGGMGAVYEVERTSDARRLALKVLIGAADRDALARFAREAQIAAQLDHPNVVSVLDVDVSRSGMLFLVMELVAGPTLAAESARYGDARWAVPILRQIAAALSAMHARGIVHRDLKPSNVLLAGESAKVADFGIASLVAPPTEPTGTDSTVSLAARAALTLSGALMGTPLYMAPELVHGARDAKPAADLWSLGVIACELLTGRRPFAEPPVLTRLNGGVLAPVSLPGIDGDLRTLIERCLQEDSDLRPTADDFVAAVTASSPDERRRSGAA